jgi:NADH oxidase (H2O2-forming)
MQKRDIIIIGGSAAGLVAASTSKSTYPEKTVTLFRKEGKVMIPCGIPYIFGTLDSSDENILPDQGLLNAGVEIVIDTITAIDKELKIISTQNGDQYEFEKLIIATGSTPFVPDFITGVDLKNVFTVPKNKEYLDLLSASLSNKNNIVVIGAGFIGVEVSDELNKSGKNVTLIEAKPHILGCTFDSESCTTAERILKDEGVTIYTNSYVEKIEGSDKVEKIVLKDGTEIETEAVILAIGYKPNITLAESSGISCNKQGAIKVDSYMRTHSPDIFACGDCAQKRDFITGKITPIMLASTACAEARVAAMNLYELNTIRTFNGTIGIYSTVIGNTTFGVAGMTEKYAEKEGFSIVTGQFKGVDRHPGKLNNSHPQSVKLVANKQTGLIMGGEIVGGVSAGELTNVLGFIIQNHMSASDIMISQIGTQPMLTSSPAAYPLIKAAEQVLKQMRK